MFNRVLRIFTIMSAVFAAGVSSYAQTNGADTGFSPYSVFGIGDLSPKGTSFNRGMAGVGIATRNKGYINTMNPASVTARDTISFMAEMSLFQNNKFMAQGDMKSLNNSANVASVTMSFPMFRKTAMMIGMTPYSSTGYYYAYRVTDPAIIGQTGDAAYTSVGSGGLNRAFVAAGVNFLRDISLGAESSVYFGNISKKNSLIFNKSIYNGITSGQDLELKAIGGKLGAQYEKLIGKNNKLGVGATYSFKSNLRGYSEDYEYSNGSTQNDTLKFKRDTLHTTPGTLSLPSEIGIGISLNHLDRWRAEFNYTRSDWSTSGMDRVNGFSVNGISTFGTGVSESMRLGFEIVPNANDIRYYYKRFAYRAGIYNEKSYFNVDGNDIRNTGITLGLSMPVYRYYNAVTFAVDLGQRSSIKNNLVRERYVNFTVGFNFFDYWFQKPKYD